MLCPIQSMSEIYNNPPQEKVKEKILHCKKIFFRQYKK